MKKTYILAGLLTLSLSACTQKFLDLAPISSINTSSYYQTASDMLTALSGAYGSLQFAGQYGQYYVMSDIPSDDTYPVLSGTVTDQDQFDKFYLLTTNPYLLAAWSDGYRGIYRCNTVIGRIEGITMDATLKSRVIGEAKFLRALMYFNLVRYFGDVPLILTEITDPLQGYNYGRTPATDVYTQIVKDLTDAETVLPVSYTGTDIGRATAGAAKSLLGKVYLTQKNYASAAAKLKEVIAPGTYSLLPSYANLFTPANKNSRESIFEVQYKKGNIGEGSSYANSYAPTNSGNAVIAFGGGGNNIPTADLERSYEANDPRKTISMATSYTNTSGAKVDAYYIKKYADQPVVANDSEDNWYVLRYADVLLMYAEALNETGKTADALPYLNQVRQRVGLADKSISTQADMRLALEQERRVELAFEGHRWFDLVRTDRAIPVLNAKAAAIGIKTPLTTNSLIFPVPQSQIDINPTKIKQNPGY